MEIKRPASAGHRGDFGHHRGLSIHAIVRSGMEIKRPASAGHRGDFGHHRGLSIHAIVRSGLSIHAIVRSGMEIKRPASAGHRGDFRHHRVLSMSAWMNDRCHSEWHGDQTTGEGDFRHHRVLSMYGNSGDPYGSNTGMAIDSSLRGLAVLQQGPLRPSLCRCCSSRVSRQSAGPGSPHRWPRTPHT